MKRKTVDDGFFMFLGNNNKEFKYRELYIDIGGAPERFKTGIEIKENTPTYITYTFNPNLENNKGILYENGTKITTTNLGDIDSVLKIQKNTNIQ